MSGDDRYGKPFPAPVDRPEPAPTALAEESPEEKKAWESVDAIHTHTLAVAKLMKLKPEQVPRLLVTASCRTVELLLDHYNRRVLVEQAGGQFPLQAKAEIRGQLMNAATDLRAALTEAAVALETMVRELDPQTVKEKED